MSTFPASASSSSSQSSRLNWQPSQEANFHTASFGFRLVVAAILQLSHGQEPAEPVVAHDGSVAAYQGRAEVAVTASPDVAFHVALQGEIVLARGDAGGVERAGGEAHHDLRAADKGDGMVPIESGAADQIRDDADMAAPKAVGVVDRHLDFYVEPAAPTFELAPEQDVRRTAGTVKHHDAAVAVALGDEPVDRRSQGGEPEPAGNNDDVAALTFRDGPGGAVRAAHPERIARLQPRYRL